MEIWRQIPDFPFYEASNLGQIRSISREAIRKNGMPMRLSGKVLKPNPLRKGHRCVNLYRDGEAITMYVHRLVAITFIGPPDGHRLHVAHWDGDPSNNRVDNLRWVTPAENSADSIRLGRNKRPAGESHFRAKLNKDVIDAMRQLSASGQSFRAIGRQFGISHNTASAAIRGVSYPER